MLARLERPEPIAHPVFELLKITAETIEWQRILRERLDDVTSLETTDSLGAERERAVVALYERSLDRSGKLLTDLAKLDLRARALKLNEETAADLMSGVVEALRRAGLAEHEAEVRMHLAAVLRERRREAGNDST